MALCRRGGAGPTPACAGSTRATWPRSRPATAYPRLRGEHPTIQAVTMTPDGLPPLARGAPCPAAGPPGRRRPTPACAGSTIGGAPSLGSRQAYPRLRGEHGSLRDWLAACWGLPPLARGAPCGDLGGLLARGPTPACAGSTPSRPHTRSGPQAYPRLRGEHCTCADDPQRRTGLPPLARGAPGNWAPPTCRPRPTPACAGSTRAIRGCAPAGWAYPRLRGEHRRRHHLRQSSLGLPPLARGAQLDGHLQAVRQRPTPACAGSTTRPRISAAHWVAYPRLRGEHARRAGCRGSCPGLPPLARGAQALGRVRRRRRGPTPACAGSTMPCRRTAGPEQAYPRLRGEHGTATCSSSPSKGLPPLARGARR